MTSQLLIDASTFLGKIWNLAKPYWYSEERWRARGLLAAVLALTLGLALEKTPANGRRTR